MAELPEALNTSKGSLTMLNTNIRIAASKISQAVLAALSLSPRAAVLAGVGLIGSALLQSPAAWAQKYLSVGINGDYGLENHAITASDLTPILITSQTSTPTQMTIAASGDTSVSQRIGVGLQDTVYAAAGAEGYASAEYGTLRTYAHYAADSPRVYLSEDNVSSINPYYTRADIQVGASWSDPMTITSATLPVGTEVDLPIDFRVDFYTNAYLQQGNGQDPMTAVASFNFGQYENSFSTNRSISGNAYFTQVDLSGGYPNPFYFHYSLASRPGYTIPVYVGDTIAWSSSFSLSGTGNVTAQDKLQDFSASQNYYIDERNTSQMFLDYVPDGVTITSASGHNYLLNSDAAGAASAPEPSALTLLAPAFLMLPAIARRRRAS